MRLVLLSRSLAGEVLGKTIYTAEGLVLLRAGTVLTPEYIEALIRKGYTSIYLRDRLAPDAEIDDAVTEQTRLKATAVAREALERASQGQPVETEKVRSVVEDILREVEANAGLVVGLSNLRAYSEYTFVHSVNVCILSLLVAQGSGFSRGEMVKLGMGAILHDLGKLRVPREILDKPGALTETEFARIKEHPLHGYEIIKNNGDMHLLSAHVAFQHHEKMDGSGYPRSLKGTNIHQFGRIAAIADIFDAVTSDRVYRGKMPPHEAAALLLSMSGLKLDANYVRQLLQRVAIYPNGSIVRLNNGKLGVVLRQEPGLPERPVIRVVADARNRLIAPREVRLSQASEQYIKGVLPDYPQRVKDQLRFSSTVT